MIGEIKKQRYVYYHCTGYADKCAGNPATCRRKHVREEALEAQFTELLGRLWFDDEVLEWVRDALHASHADERRDHEEAIQRHQAEYKRLDERIHAAHPMYPRGGNGAGQSILDARALARCFPVRSGGGFCADRLPGRTPGGRERRRAPGFETHRPTSC